jgi:hypothetical protein
MSTSRRRAARRAQLYRLAGTSCTAARAASLAVARSAALRASDDGSISQSAADGEPAAAGERARRARLLGLNTAAWQSHVAYEEAEASWLFWADWRPED